MFASSLLAAGVLALSAAVEARPIPHTVRLYRRAELERRATKIDYATQRNAPKEWALDHNEPYTAYHFRYLTIGCAQMHDTSFFDKCCHPRIYYQKDSDYDYECNLEAHVTDIPAKKLQKQVKAANADASNHRELKIVSISSASSASVASIKSTHSAHIASKSSASVASIKSTHSEHLASKSAASAASAASIESIHSKHQASKSAASASSASVESVQSSKEHSSKEPKTHSPHSKPTPTPTTTHTSEEAKPTSTDSGSSGSQGGSGSSSGGGGGQMYGAKYGTPAFGTWFKQAGTIGACGLQSGPISDWSKVVAQRYDLYGDGSACGRTVRITNTDNGKSVDAIVNDECMGCGEEYSLDLSLGAFTEIADFATGMVPIEWEYITPYQGGQGY